MKQKSLLFIVLVYISLLSLTITPTLAVQDNYETRFCSYAVGGCAKMPYIGAHEDIFIGKGAMYFVGSAKVNSYPSNSIPFPHYLAESGVKAFGRVYAQWDNHMINIFIYSNKKVGGLFIDEDEMRDVFSIGILVGGGIIGELMSFKGIYKDPTGIHFITGKAGVFAAPLPGTKMIIGVMLYTWDNTELMTLLWSLEDIVGSISIPAADIFKHIVKIT